METAFQRKPDNDNKRDADIAPRQDRHLPDRAGQTLQRQRGGGAVVQRKTNISYGNTRRITYRAVDSMHALPGQPRAPQWYTDVVATEAEAELDPADPVKGTGVGSRTGIYERYDLIQGHLLNADLGGRALDCNLFPLTREANKNHGGIEGEVKNIYRRIEPNGRIYYKVIGVLATDQFWSREDYINNSRLLCSIGTCEGGERKVITRDFMIQNYTDLTVPGTNGSEERMEIEEQYGNLLPGQQETKEEKLRRGKLFWDGDGAKTYIKYHDAVKVRYDHGTKTYEDWVSGGVTAWLHPDSMNTVKGTNVGEKRGIYRTYRLVQGHMLNAELGGRAINQNLFPISEGLNQHHAGIENEVKKRYTRCAGALSQRGDIRNRIYYQVVPEIMGRRKFKSKNDFLRRTQVRCTVITPDGKKEEIVLTNDVPADNVRKAPGARKKEPFGRFDAAGVQERIMTIWLENRQDAAQNAYVRRHFVDQCMIIFRRSKRFLIHKLKLLTFLNCEEQYYPDDLIGYNEWTKDKVSLFIQTVYFQSLDELASMDIQELADMFMGSGITSTEALNMFPL